MPIPKEEQKIRQIIREELETLFKIDKFTFEKHIQILDARNIQLGRNTGTKIGTATDQKAAFFGVTPVVQASAIGNASGTDAAIIDAIRTAIKNFGIIA